MALQNVLDAIVFWDSANPPQNWNMHPQTANQLVGTRNALFEEKVLSYILNLYNESPTMQALLDEAAENPIYIAQNITQPGRTFEEYYENGVTYDQFVSLNFDIIDQLGWINKNGEWVKFDPELVIAHEFAHRFWQLLGFPTSDDPSQLAQDQNDPNFDNDGYMVRFQNKIAEELGKSENSRVSYYFNGELDLFRVGVSLTEGQEIDIARFSPIGSVLDTSNRTDGSRDLLIGIGGNDVIRSGDGADHLYGNDGDDVLDGGGGYDHIYGGTGDDVLIGRAGNDVLLGMEEDDNLDGGSGDDLLIGGDGADLFFGDPGNDEIWGGDQDEEVAQGIDVVDYTDANGRIKVVVSPESLIVHDGDGGMDRLHAINKIVGTDKRDLLTIEGNISADSDPLTIDANGGQGSSPSDTINFSAANSAMLVEIDENGNGTILDTNTTGVIYLKGFHTSLIGSGGDDVISDASSGQKHISGFYGDDQISAIGGAAYVDGGAGDDVITGGVYNDVLIAGVGTDILNGGAGSDTLIGTVEERYSWTIPPVGDTLDGGDGSDMLINGLVMKGGAGNDIIDARGFTAVESGGNFSDWATIEFGVGGGHDMIVGNSAGVGKIDLSSVSKDDVTVYWDFAGTVTLDSGGTYTRHAGGGDLTIVLGSGDSLNLGYITGTYNTYTMSGRIWDVFIDAPHVVFSDYEGISSPLEMGAPVEIIYSGYSGGQIALTDFSGQSGGGDVDGTSGDDSIAGSSGDDNIEAGDGDDEIDLSGGSDLVNGGSGNDTVFFFGSIDDFSLAQSGTGIALTSLSGLEGRSTVTDVENFYSITDDRTWTLAQMIGRISTDGNDNMIGTDDNDNLYAGLGDDTLKGFGGNDLLDGGDGNDQAIFRGNSADYIISSFYGDHVVVDIVGDDGVDSTISVESLYFEGDNVTISSSDINEIIGTEGDDALAGGNGRDSIYSLGGYDTIDAGAGDDYISSSPGMNTIDGGSGLDVVSYWGNSSDYQIDLHSDGTVTVFGLNGRIADDVLTNVERLYFDGDQALINVADLVPSLPSEPQPINGTAGDDTLYGTSGSDLIDGGEGADLMIGDAGDDYYIVDNAGDVVVEEAGEGYDRVGSYVSYTLSDNVEELQLGGGDAINATGNGLNNVLVGNEAANTLTGMGGADEMTGGDGNDSYIVENVGDIVIENADEGWDGVVSIVDYTLPDNVEGLYLDWQGGISATGNDLENEISGNDLDNILSGRGGADYMVGGYGNDRLSGDEGDDLVAGEQGSGDVAVYAGEQSTFTLSTASGSLTITDNDAVADGNEGSDLLYGIEIVEFKGGIQSGISSPIVLDLNGDGVSLVDNSQATATFDWDGDGVANQSGWIGSDDGFLFIDRDGNGTVTNGGELSFTSDKSQAKSDLDGLRAFDTDGDGMLSVGDDQFAQFGVWQDRDGNGVVGQDEILSLEAAGVAGINLAGQAVNQSWNWNENVTINTGSYQRTDGSLASFSDVALSYDTGSVGLGFLSAPSESGAIHYATSDAARAASQLSEAISAFGEAAGSWDAGRINVWIDTRETYLGIRSHTALR